MFLFALSFELLIVMPIASISLSIEQSDVCWLVTSLLCFRNLLWIIHQIIVNV